MRFLGLKRRAHEPERAGGYVFQYNAFSRPVGPGIRLIDLMAVSLSARIEAQAQFHRASAQL